MPRNKSRDLQDMFNQKFLDVVRGRGSPFFDSGCISKSWDDYMSRLELFGVVRGGWLRGLLKRSHIRLIDPVTLDQYADWSECCFLPTNIVLNIVGPSYRTIFVPRDFADKALVFGGLPI